MLLELHPDVYRAAYEAGLRTLSDHAVRFLSGLPTEEAIDNLSDARCRKLLLRLPANAEEPSDSDRRFAARWRLDPSICEHVRRLGYELNHNFAAFLNGFDTVEAAHAHLGTMKPRRKRTPRMVAAS